MIIVVLVFPDPEIPQMMQCLSRSSSCNPNGYNFRLLYITCPIGYSPRAFSFGGGSRRILSLFTCWFSVFA
jgi:hypothetical protein